MFNIYLDNYKNVGNWSIRYSIIGETQVWTMVTDYKINELIAPKTLKLYYLYIEKPWKQINKWGHH